MKLYNLKKDHNEQVSFAQAVAGLEQKYLAGTFFRTICRV